MKLLNQKEISAVYNNQEDQITMYHFFKNAYEEGFLSEDRFKEASNLMNYIFRLRNNYAIDDSFREIFTEDNEQKFINDARNMGADIAGLEINNKTILCTNVEFGVNFMLLSPKKEDVEEYLILISTVAEALVNPTNLKALLNYNNLNTKIEKANLNNKSKEKQNKL